MAINASLNSTINEVKGDMPSTTKLATTAGLTTVGNKIGNVSYLVKKNTLWYRNKRY